MLPGVMSPEQLVDVVETQSAAPEPCIVLIDDAHLVADDSQIMAFNPPSIPGLGTSAGPSGLAFTV